MKKSLVCLSLMAALFAVVLVAVPALAGPGPEYLIPEVDGLPGPGGSVTEYVHIPDILVREGQGWTHGMDVTTPIVIKPAYGLYLVFSGLEVKGFNSQGMAVMNFGDTPEEADVMYMASATLVEGEIAKLSFKPYVGGTYTVVWSGSIGITPDTYEPVAGSFTVTIPPMYGDCDMNGVLDVWDVWWMLDFLVGNAFFWDDYQRVVIDFNRDESGSYWDAVHLLRHILGLPPLSPVAKLAASDVENPPAVVAQARAFLVELASRPDRDTAGLRGEILKLVPEAAGDAGAPTVVESTSLGAIKARFRQ